MPEGQQGQTPALRCQVSASCGRLSSVSRPRVLVAAAPALGCHSQSKGAMFCLLQPPGSHPDKALRRVQEAAAFCSGVASDGRERSQTQMSFGVEFAYVNHVCLFFFFKAVLLS